MNFSNPITLIDGYKLDHRRQYPRGTTRVYSNWTPRQSRVPGVDSVVFFGLQYFLDRYLDARNGEFSRFFAESEDEVVRVYEERHRGYLGPNSIGSEHVRQLHRLGHLPVEVRAFPEGTSVPLRVPMLTIENTLPEFFWVTNYLETLLSCVLWHPCTTATLAKRMRRSLVAAAAATGTSTDFVDWQGHDFSFRGMSGPEAAAISGAAHLLSFNGTDTLPAIDLVERHYGPLPSGYLLAGSVAATEHSVMCAGGELRELETFERILELYPTGIVSIVSDTWDLWSVLKNVMWVLKPRIMGRDGKVVIRPDSGDPADILCGDPKALTGSPASEGVVQLLWTTFGGSVTATGHRLLDPHVGCIYGDSITFERAEEITRRLAEKGFASGNVVFGVGSYSYQHVTRDTFGFALKSTWCEIDGVGHDIFKKPLTDDGVKNSARGRIAVLKNGRAFELTERATPEQEAASYLSTVWKDGEFVRRETFDVVRSRVRGG